MVFSDPFFIFVFLPTAFLICILSKKYFYALALLLVSSIFYFWSSGQHLIVMLFSIGFNWFVARQIFSGDKTKKAYLVFGVGVNLAILVYFKYALFFAVQLDLLISSEFAEQVSNIVLPVGISFYTFQAISYLFDVYRSDVEVENNPITFGAYLSFFPQLIAGPIVRFRDVVKSYHAPEINLSNVSIGLTRFVHGLLKKVLIADVAGEIANACFLAAEGGGSFWLSWVGGITYAIQIYFDFSAYSDMAIGIGLAFGVKFGENFRRPYAASTITSFWRRWHISLSTWFRDYLYIPLGGSRLGVQKTYRNLLIVFLVTGLWHGAAWTFIVWGLFHGAFLIAERFFLKGRAAELTSPIMRYCYLLPVIIIGWVIFRAESYELALDMIIHMTFVHEISVSLPSDVLQVLDPKSMILLMLGSLVFIQNRSESYGSSLMNSEPSKALFWARAAYTAIGLPIALIWVFSSDFSPFLYFRF